MVLTPLRIHLRHPKLSDDLQWLTRIVVKVILHHIICGLFLSL
jgi:hypothetical protein